jgi:hypothetical protein
MRFGALSFGERFGEVRSALQQAPSQEGFERLLWMLTCMHKQDAARFEAQVFSYAREGLERWYAACPLGLDGVGELVCTGARGDRWRVVGRAPRGERVARAPRGEVWLKVARSARVTVNWREEQRLAGARMERLERLCLIPKMYSEYELSAALRAPWLEQLTGLEARGLMLGGGLASWSGRDLGRLEALDLTGAYVSDWYLRAVGALEGLRMVGLPYGLYMYRFLRHSSGRHGADWHRVAELEGRLVGLIEGARWRAVEVLSGELWTEAMTRAVAARGWPVREVRLAGGCSWSGRRRNPGVVAGVIEALEGLERLRVVGASLAEIVLGEGLREVEVLEAEAGGMVSAVSGVERLSWSARAGSGSWDELVAWLEGGGAPRLRVLRVWEPGGRQEALGPVWTKLVRFAGERGVRLENCEFGIES